MSHELGPADVAQLEAAGIPRAEAERQLEQLRRGEAWTRIDRPATPGDGIETLDAAAIERSLAAHAAAAAAGRFGAFVPASGAASRMFKELLAVRAAGAPDAPDALARAVAAGDGDARALRAFLDGLDRFAFTPALAAALARRGFDLATLVAGGPFRPILDALLGPDGLDYAERPKGVLAFHRDGAAVRTAFEEHLAECAHTVRSGDGACRVHLTVSPAHRALFEQVLDAARAPLEAGLGVRYEVTFSTQDPATDTLAVDGEGRPWRNPDGSLLLRPAGHGALIHNLERTGGDLVFLKNIDNVAHPDAREATLRWVRVLLGVLVETEAAAAHLGRPVRVCGMVPNTGEPGGGPFWVRGRDGACTLQVVESAQVDPGDPAARAAFARGTHFNPVFLACALRDQDGRPHPLDRFVDPEAIILTRKSSGGRELVALERPGLWNGAMAGWHTRFIEVPLGIFNPVKTVLDLLRPAHQPR